MLDSPVVRTLSRHLVARFVQLFFLVATVTALSLGVVELLLNVDDMLAFGSGLSGALGYLRLRLASEYASYIVPLAAFLAAFSVCALAAYHREWTALKAGGVPLARFALPLLCCGAVTAVAAAVIHETWTVSARQQWARARDGDPNIRFKEGSFWYQRGNRIYRVAEADRGSRTLREVRVFERDPGGRLRRSLAAERVEILDERRWRFHDLVLRHFDPDRPTVPASIERAQSLVLEIADPRDRALMGADPATLGLVELLEFIETKEASGRDASPQWSVLYARFTDWVSVALLVAVAVPLGLGVDRTRNLGRSAAQATLVLVGFYALRNVSSVVSLQGLLPPATPWLALLAALAGFTLVAFSRTPR